MRDILVEFMERFFSGYARLSFLNFFVNNKSVKTCSFEVKMHPIHKNRVQIKIQQQHTVVVNNINQSFILKRPTRDSRPKIKTKTVSNH